MYGLASANTAPSMQKPNSMQCAVGGPLARSITEILPVWQVWGTARNAKDGPQHLERRPSKRRTPKPLSARR